MKTTFFFCLSLLFFIQATGQDTRLLRDPDISDRHIAFSYAGDIWISDLNGQNVRRLTASPGGEGNPHFSPDGRQLAFTGQYDGNTDVYVVDVNGGDPLRLTFHPSADWCRGWSANGQSVLFASGRAQVPHAIPIQWWQIDPSGGFPDKYPVDMISVGMESIDGQWLAYQAIRPWESEFRNYRGGQNNPIRLLNLNSFELKKIPWTDSNDQQPVWLDGKVYFLSDRNVIKNIWEYDPASVQLKQQTKFDEFDCKGLASGGDHLIFENGGYLYKMKAGGQAEKIKIQITDDFYSHRPQWENVSEDIQTATLTPTGQRALFAARGDIFSVPAEHGSIRNLSASSGVADRNPAASPDGRHVSWFSDEGGEYQLVIADPHGQSIRKIKLSNPTFFYDPVWSPDSKWISFGDTDRNLWVLEVATQQVRKIDNEGFAHPERTIYPEWSPDSRYIAYTKRLPNEYNTLYVYDLENKTNHQLTDGMSDCRAPAWDAGGKYISFLASTDYGLNVGWLDMSSIERPMTRAVYAIVLDRETDSPTSPRSDEEEPKEEEKPKEEGNDEDKEDGPKVNIDFENISQRIVALDIPPRPYVQLKSGAEGQLFVSENVPNESGLSLHRYDFEKRKLDKIGSGIQAFGLSSDGQKLLYAMNGNQWGIAEAGGQLKDGKMLQLGNMRMLVDLQAEWAQMFREAWRYQRDYFYVENVHGLDLDWAYKTYSPWVKHARNRSDITYLLDIFSGETSVGHSFVRGGKYPDREQVPVGLLGADLSVENGHYRIDKIYTGENWNPDLRSPLNGPGIHVKEGDYILAINGVAIDAKRNFYSYFDQTSGQQIMLRLSDSPNGSDVREETVVPVGSEYGLRQYDWMESNRRKVDELSGGQLAYLWLPNTGLGGFRNFNRYYFAQQDKKGVIIDERFNQGGYAADYIVDLLSRKLIGYFNNPVGDRQPFTSPAAGIWGPKVMIVNAYAGSGGDYLPYMFREKEIGTIVGTRTWGGLVGVWDVPPLIDGGSITAPRGGFYNAKGEWDVENIGVAPDIVVEQHPKELRDGRDPQLEKAVEVALQQLKENPVVKKPQPADPVRVPRMKKK